MYKVCFILLLNAAACFCLNYKFNLKHGFFDVKWRHNPDGHEEKPDSVSSGKQTDRFPDQYFEQKLDHSMPTDERTWNQRYFVNNLYFQPDGPIFLFVYGEAEAHSYWMQTGQWISFAKKFNALCFLLEHRFYGKSKPFSNSTVENLAYLTTEQALADIAYFIEAINNEYDLSDTTKWILFGGSYAGSLVAWARMKYPHLVHGAVSSSAPLLAQANFPEYFVVVRRSLATHSISCVRNIAAATKRLKSAVKTVSGRSAVSKLFRLCNPLKNNYDDIATFFGWLMDISAYAAQYNRMPFSIDDVCTIMNEKQISPVKRYAKLNDRFLKYFRENCTRNEYKDMIDHLQQSEWKEWIYQTCSEYGYYQTTDQTSDTFGDYLNLDYFIKMCQDLFGTTFDGNFIDNAVLRTNIEFGELKFTTNNIIFVHGSLDPWQALGIVNGTKNSPFKTIYVNGAAHCDDMFSSSNDDSEDLKAARHEIFTTLKSWLSSSEIAN